MRLLPDWERVLSAAARPQRPEPRAVLAGGTAAAVDERDRQCQTSDQVLQDSQVRFGNALRDLQSVAGWETRDGRNSVLVSGSLDGIETGVRQLVRQEPLEMTVVEAAGGRLVVPTVGEVLRIRSVLLLKRNVTRDYIDFAALADQVGDAQSARALRRFDVLYPQISGESALQQVLAQLADPQPYDLDETRPVVRGHCGPLARLGPSRTRLRSHREGGVRSRVRTRRPRARHGTRAQVGEASSAVRGDRIRALKDCEHSARRPTLPLALQAPQDRRASRPSGGGFAGCPSPATRHRPPSLL